MIHSVFFSEHGHVGDYLSGIGLLRTLARGFPDATAWWNLGLIIDLDSQAVEDHLIQIAHDNSWLAPTSAPVHPVLGIWGRRVPHRWVVNARELLASLPEEKLREDIRWHLQERYRDPIRVTQSKRLPLDARRNYGLGTIFPYTVPHPATCNPGMCLPALTAVLAWESWDWLRHGSPTDAKRDATWSWTHERKPHLGWTAVSWRRPVRLQELPLLWRGGRRLTGTAWSSFLLDERAIDYPRAARVLDWDLRFHPHTLLATNEGSKTAEAWPANTPHPGLSVEQKRTWKPRYPTPFMFF